MPLDNSKYTLLLLLFTPGDPEKILQTLREFGFRVRATVSLEEAMCEAASNPPDLILTDARQVRKGKNTMIRQLKNDKATCSIPILFISSVTLESQLSEYLSDDNVDFISHPFPPRELIVRIQHQLLLAQAEQTIRKQNEKFKKTLEARDKLYSVIAHDLRAPIGTIKMINSSIENQKDLIKNPEILKLFEMISETTEEAFNLLENLLRWTRNQNGKTKIYATTFNIALAIRQVISLFTTIAEAKNIHLQNHATENLYIHADEDMIKTVLRNLISNAIKFTYPGGKIEVNVQDKPEGVMISVKDNGKGISRAMQPQLFKPNEYVTTYGTRNEKGSGLGLILCQDFIKMNKGKFCFSSKEGVGTTFYFLLPKAPLSVQEPEKSR